MNTQNVIGNCIHTSEHLRQNCHYFIFKSINLELEHQTQVIIVSSTQKEIFPWMKLSNNVFLNSLLYFIATN